MKLILQTTSGIKKKNPGKQYYKLDPLADTRCSMKIDMFSLGATHSDLPKSVPFALSRRTAIITSVRLVGGARNWNSARAALGARASVVD